MVDRIVPATTAADRAEAAALLRLADAGVVATEPFRQWVVQDTFAAGRPAWEAAGAVLTDDVAPYEAIKLRLLNGSHSLLAYLGALAGHEHVADAVADPALAAAVAALMAEVVPTLTVPAGFDVQAYCAELVQRWHNPLVRHRTLQIAMDGSSKLPQRLLAPARELLAAGREPRLVCLALAAWLRFVSAGESDAGRPLPLDDPLADRLRAAVAGRTEPAAVADALLGLPEVFGDDLPADPRFRALVTDSLTTLTRAGAAAAARDAVRTESP
jgi:fructuronate reductase